MAFSWPKQHLAATVPCITSDTVFDALRLRELPLLRSTEGVGAPKKVSGSTVRSIFIVVPRDRISHRVSVRLYGDDMTNAVIAINATDRPFDASAILTVALEDLPRPMDDLWSSELQRAALRATEAVSSCGNDSLEYKLLARWCRAAFSLHPSSAVQEMPVPHSRLTDVVLVPKALQAVYGAATFALVSSWEEELSSSVWRHADDTALDVCTRRHLLRNGEKFELGDVLSDAGKGPSAKPQGNEQCAIEWHISAPAAVVGPGEGRLPPLPPTSIACAALMHRLQSSLGSRMIDGLGMPRDAIVSDNMARAKLASAWSSP